MREKQASEILLEVLLKLLPSQFSMVLFLTEVERAYIPHGSQADQAIALVELLKAKGRLEILRYAIVKTAPYLEPHLDGVDFAMQAVQAQENAEQERIKILFLAANPAQMHQLRLDAEFRNIDEMLTRSPMRDRFELVSSWATRVSDLQHQLMRHEPDIVHFAGHGARMHREAFKSVKGLTRNLEAEVFDDLSQYGLVFHDDDRGNVRVVSSRSVGRLFELLKDNVRCVLLNACYTAGLADAIAQNIDAVVGTTREVRDEAAIAFSGSFYQALGNRKNLEQAYKLAKNGVDLDGLAEDESVFKLVVREGVDPSSIVLA